MHWLKSKAWQIKNSCPGWRLGSTPGCGWWRHLAPDWLMWWFALWKGLKDELGSLSDLWIKTTETNSQENPSTLRWKAPQLAHESFSFFFATSPSVHECISYAAKKLKSTGYSLHVRNMLWHFCSPRLRFVHIIYFGRCHVRLLQNKVHKNKHK